MGRALRRELVLALSLMVLVMAPYVGSEDVGSEELRLETSASIHCGSVRLYNVPLKVANAKVKFRKEGSKTWQEGLPLVGTWINQYASSLGVDKRVLDKKQELERCFFGSLFYLSPSSQYNLQVVLEDEEGKEIETVNGSLRTKSDTVTYGKGKELRVGGEGKFKTIIEAMRAAEPGDIVVVSPGVYSEELSIAGKQGTRDNPITVRGEEGTIIEAKQPGSGNGIHVENSSNMIIEGFTIKNFGYGIWVAYSQNIVVQNNKLINTDQGFRIKQVRDSLFQFNDVTKKTGRNGYVVSQDCGRGNILRYNRLIARGGSYDIMYLRGGWDVDIYENNIEGVPADDGIEIESGISSNVRFFNNRLSAVGGGASTISTSDTLVGPMYVVRNLVLCAGEAIKSTSSGGVRAMDYVKEGHEVVDLGKVLYLHNLFYNEGLMSMFRGPMCHSNFLFHNNIFHGVLMPAEREVAAQQPKTSNAYGKLESDYNLFWLKGAKGLLTKVVDQHSLFSVPQFKDAVNGDFSLKEGSPAIDHGVRLLNLNDSFTGKAPDIGPYEYELGWVGQTLKDPKLKAWLWGVGKETPYAAGEDIAAKLKEEQKEAPVKEAGELMPNGDVEQGALYWGKHAQIDTEDPHSGKNCLIIRGKGEPKAINSYIKIIPVEAGKTYVIKFWMKGDGGTLRVKEVTAEGVQSDAHKNKGGMAETWREFQLEYAVPEGVVGFSVEPRVVGGGDCRFDDFSVKLKEE